MCRKTAAAPVTVVAMQQSVPMQPAYGYQPYSQLSAVGPLAYPAQPAYAPPHVAQPWYGNPKQNPMDLL